MRISLLSLPEQRDGALLAGAEDGAVHDLLADAAQRGGERAAHRLARLQAVDQVLDGVPAGRGRRVHGDVLPLRLRAGLDADGVLVVVGADRALRPDEDKAAA